MIALCIVSVGLLGGQELVEPNTSAAFERRTTRNATELVLTGVDRRRVMGKDAYAVAHYAHPDAVAGPSHDAANRLESLIDSNAPKMLVFHGVHGKVPARAIRWSWQRHFDAIDEQVNEEFIAVFQEPFRKGERLYFIVSEPGILEVVHGEATLGRWEDPDLVRALWRMCLGPESEVVERENLVGATGVSDHVASNLAREGRTGRDGQQAGQEGANESVNR